MFSTVITAAVAGDRADPLRDGYPNISVSEADRSRMEPGMTLVSFGMGNNGRFMTRPFIIDAKGRIRWLFRLDALKNWASPVERLENGNLVFGRGGYVYEYSMLGRQVHAWNIGRYGFTQHHDIFEITTGPHRGDLLVAVDRTGADTVEDAVIEIDRGGSLIDTWDMREVLDVDRGNILRNRSDWLHMNAVLYDPRDDSIIISGRLDERSKTVSQVWQYGASRGSDYYSDIISDVDILSGRHHRLITSGSIRHSSSGAHAYVTEITYPDARTVFEARIGFRDAHCNFTAGGWGNFDIVYRGERLPLYPGIRRVVR